MSSFKSLSAHLQVFNGAETLLSLPPSLLHSYLFAFFFPPPAVKKHTGVMHNCFKANNCCGHPFK